MVNHTHILQGHYNPTEAKCVLSGATRNNMGKLICNWIRSRRSYIHSKTKHNKTMCRFTAIFTPAVQHWTHCISLNKEIDLTYIFTEMCLSGSNWQYYLFGAHWNVFISDKPLEAPASVKRVYWQYYLFGANHYLNECLGYRRIYIYKYIYLYIYMRVNRLRQLGEFFSNVISFSNFVQYQCHILVPKLSNTLNNSSALWILMACCFSTRASVATILSTNPCVSRCLWDNIPSYRLSRIVLHSRPS